MKDNKQVLSCRVTKNSLKALDLLSQYFMRPKTSIVDEALLFYYKTISEKTMTDAEKFDYPQFWELFK